MNNPPPQELEVKFYLAKKEAFLARLEQTQAALLHPRVLETNLRFDTPAGELARTFQVLRLRQDSAARLTYKGPGDILDGVRRRVELEFTVSDFAAAQAFLEALGYQVALLYEKYRTTYTLGNVEVTLDEMPYGFFAEIEGPDGGSILRAAERLGLAWETRIFESYVFLFDRLRQTLGLTFRDLSFANFTGMTVTAEQLGVMGAMGESTNLH